MTLHLKMNDAPCQEDSPHTDDICTDKKLLLTHWVSCQTAIPADSLELKQDELHTSSFEMSEDLRKQKRRGICSPEELEFELEGDKKVMEMSEENKENDFDARKHKRRGICSLEPAMELELSGELKDDHMQPNELDCSEDIRWQKRRGICSSIDLGLELDAKIESIETIKSDPQGNVEQDSVDKSENNNNNNNNNNFASMGLTRKQIEETVAVESGALKQNELRLIGSDESPSEVLSAPSEVLSAHDYENICAVNIAREAWGLRSWRGYSDIETWLHDDSVVRDRRRDTLTSTATTLTSASSEHSTGSGEPVSVGVSPPPIPCRRPRIQRSRQDDYLDTLVDDLADCETIRPLAEFVSEPDIEQNVFVARPYVIDQHGTLFPLTTLDTIMEELEESSTDTGDSIRQWQRHGSASTLVATIDEIRRGNSICNLYNSSEALWDVCGNSSVDATSDQDPQAPCDNIMHSNSPYSSSLHRSLLMSTHSRSHLSPEEVLFLSKLQPSPDTEIESSPNRSPPRLSKSPQHSPEIILGATPYLLSDEPKSQDNPLENAQASVDMGYSGRKKSANRPRRKFSLLREKFELRRTGHKSELESDSIDVSHLSFPSPLDSSLTAVYSELCTDDAQINILGEPVALSSNEPVVSYNKENVTPAVTSRIRQWNNFLKTQNSCNSKPSTESSKVISLPSNPECNANKNTKSNFTNLKERRSMFLKQVLSPPKFQNWSKRGSVSLSSKEVEAS